MDVKENFTTEDANTVLDGVLSTTVENGEDSEGRNFGRRLQLVSNTVVEPNEINCDGGLSTEVAETVSTSSSSSCSATALTPKKRRGRYAKKPVDDSRSEERFKSLMDVIKRATELQREISRKVNELHSRRVTGTRGGPQSQNLGQSSVASSSNGEDSTLQENNEAHEEFRKTEGGLTVPFEQPLLLEGTALREHQMHGFKWLHAMDINIVNGILGDEMGLGKTVQVIAMICFLIENGYGGPFVVLAPLSIVPVWIEQFKMFAPRVPTMSYTGTLAERRLLFPQVTKVHKIYEDMTTTPVVVCPYHLPIRDPYLGKVQWRYMVVDEGHRLNNPSTQIHRSLLTWGANSRCILTGTPLQNDVKDLWSLLNFLMPELFDKLDTFESWFSSQELASGDKDVERRLLEKERTHSVATCFRDLLSAFLLRRLKSEVDLEIPAKTELILTCGMTDEQARLYNVSLNPQEYKPPEESLVDANGKRKKRRCVERAQSYREFDRGDLEDDTNTMSDSGKENLVSLLQNRIKRHCMDMEASISDDLEEETLHTPGKANTQLCDDSPSNNLLNEFDRNEDTPKNLNRLAESQQMMTLRHIANHPKLLLKNKGYSTTFNEELVQRSSKLILLDGMLKSLIKKNHKVLIFSFFTMVLDLISELLEARGYNFCRIDGSCSLEARQEQINNFTSKGVSIFIMTTRTGGLGLNLISADTVIFFDNDWNPQIDLQAEARCHRIGQLKPVAVYRLAVKDTIDIAMLMRAEGKQKLSALLLSENDMYSNKLETKSRKFTLEMFQKLLQQKSQPLVEPRNGNNYTEEELEELLDRSKTRENVS